MNARMQRLSRHYALPKFGPHLWEHHEREANKRGPKLTLEDCERHLYALFCRSVITWGEPTHPTFADYAAIILEGPLIHICGDLGPKMRELYPGGLRTRDRLSPAFRTGEDSRSSWEGFGLPNLEKCAGRHSKNPRDHALAALKYR